MSRADAILARVEAAGHAAVRIAVAIAWFAIPIGIALGYLE